MTVYTMDYPKIGPFTWEASQGVSEQSDELDTILGVVKKHFSENISFGWRQTIQNQIIDLFQRCSYANWDGYDAEPISEESKLTALILSENLPDNIIPPKIVPDPDGEIAFEWYSKEGKDIFSFSVESGSIIYAGIFNDSRRLHGEELFLNEIPKTIIDILSKYFSKG